MGEFGPVQLRRSVRALTMCISSYLVRWLQTATSALQHSPDTAAAAYKRAAK